MAASTFTTPSATDWRICRPTPTQGADQTVPDTDRDGTELVTLDGSASSDSDGSIASYEWREGGTSIGAGATPAVWLSVGTHTLTLEVTDDDGDSATDTVVITVSPPIRSRSRRRRPRPPKPVQPMACFTVSRTGDTSASLTVQLHGRRHRHSGHRLPDAPRHGHDWGGIVTATVVVTPIDDASARERRDGHPDAWSGCRVQSRFSERRHRHDRQRRPPTRSVVASMTAPSEAGADTDIVVTDTTRNQGTGSSPAVEHGILSVHQYDLGCRGHLARQPGGTVAWPWRHECRCRRRCAFRHRRPRARTG